ncbi:hypothetical protein ACFLSW_02290 [Candidatus Bipolaricaulota bacterium]
MANLDGTGGSSFGALAGTVDLPYDIALDVAAERMYATSDGNNTVAISDLDGMGGTALAVATLSRPMGIALDTAAGKMYITNNVNGTVIVANLDDSGGSSLGTLGGTLNEPREIALSP